MSAKERMVASEKGYENGIGAMSAEARMAASEKGCENGITKGLESKAEAKSESWEVQYAEFKNYDGMPESPSASYNWQRNQLTSFDGKIKKEIAANKGSTIWKDRRARLVACIAKKDHDKWEVQYAGFDDGMPERGSTSYIWQKNQLTRLDGKIKNEITANEGSTVWRDRRARLKSCITRKKSALTK